MRLFGSAFYLEVLGCIYKSIVIQEACVRSIAGKVVIRECMIRVADVAWPHLRDDIVRADPSQTAGDVDLPRRPHPAAKLKSKNDHK